MLSCSGSRVQSLAAFAAFYDRYEAAWSATSYVEFETPEVVADLTAEVFAAALHAGSRYRAIEATAAGWLLGLLEGLPHEQAAAIRARVLGE